MYIPWHFPLHQNPKITGASLEAEKAFENQYPAIYNHLLQYKTQLLNRNKSETGIRYEWYALQRWGANYWEDFNRQKIIWKIIGDKMTFVIDSDKFMVNNACYILTGNDLEYLLTILNSRIIKWYSFLTNMNKTGIGDMQVGAQNVTLFPIPCLCKLEQKPYIDLLKKILTAKEDNENITTLEIDINRLVYKLYDLTSEEIEFIEFQ